MADIYFYKSITGQIYNFRDDRVDNISGILPATAAPLMDGTAAVGTSIKYAREDHVHPSDTSKVDKEAGKGLSTNDFTTALKDKLDGIEAGAQVNVQPNIPYFTCTTAAATAAKEATLVSGSFTSADLVTGAQIAVKFSNANTVASPTLQAGNTAAQPIKRYGTTAPSTSAASSWNAGSVIYFVYDGTYWQMVGWLNTTYSGMTDAEYQAGTSTTNRLITPARLKAAIQYYATYSAGNGLELNGTTFSAVDADMTHKGILTLSDQIIRGNKWFNDNIVLYNYNSNGYGDISFKKGSSATPDSSAKEAGKISLDTTATSLGSSNLMVTMYSLDDSFNPLSKAEHYSLPYVTRNLTNDYYYDIITTKDGIGKLTGYGECSTAGSTAAKTVTVANLLSLKAGVTIHVKFTNTNTATSPTLNVNGLGAKAICQNGAVAAGTTEATSWKNNAVVTLTYDGTRWLINR